MRTALLACAFLAACVAAPRSVPLCDVVKVECPDGSGSAVPLNSRWLLTAKHLVPIDTAGDAKVVQVIEHPDEDVALIRVESPRAWRCPPLGREQPAMGDPLVAGGFGGMGSLRWRDGRQGAGAALMSCPMVFGDSGGAVLNLRGELVGNMNAVEMMTRDNVRIPIPHCAYMVPVIPLREWIESNIKP